MFFSVEHDFGVSLNDMSNARKVYRARRSRLLRTIFSKTSVKGYQYHGST